MIYKASPEFWDCYDALPEHIRRLADKNFKLLKNDLGHPSLRSKKVDVDTFSARVGKKYRVLAAEDGDEMVWFWIGLHTEYDRLLSQ